MKKLTENQKRDFITEHISYVSEKRREAFNALSIDVQYKRIKECVRRAKRGKTTHIRTINEILTAYLKTKKADYQTAVLMRDKLNKWIDETSTRKYVEIDEDIKKKKAEFERQVEKMKKEHLEQISKMEEERNSYDTDNSMRKCA